MARQAGFDEATEVEESTFDALNAVREAIRYSKPKTIADLAVLANACVTVDASFWDVPANDLDLLEGFVRRLIEAVLELAGAKLIIEGLPTPQTVGSAWARAKEAGLRI